MYKKTLIKMGLMLLNFALERIFNNVGKDPETITKEEAYNYVVDKLEEKYNKK